MSLIFFSIIVSSHEESRNKLVHLCQSWKPNLLYVSCNPKKKWLRRFLQSLGMIVAVFLVKTIDSDNQAAITFVKHSNKEELNIYTPRIIL